MERPNIQEIRERCDAATKGRWNECCLTEMRRAGDDNRPPLIAIQTHDPFVEIVRGHVAYYDALFIAHSRVDIPALLEWIGHIETENTVLEVELGRAEWDYREKDRLEAEIAALKQELAMYRKADRDRKEGA